MAEEFVDILSAEEAERQVEEAGELAKVQALDPDFILMLFFALFVDIVDIAIFILAFFDVFTLSSAISITIDVFILLIIGGWIHHRTKRIAESKRERQAAVTRSMQQSLKHMQRLQKVGKVSPEVFARYMRRFGQSMGRMGRVAARLSRRTFFRVLLRVGVALLGEAIIFIGIIPFWTITVIAMLRSK